MALKYVKYHIWNELPVQVRCMILDARDLCTGMTQRDGMGREEEGGFRMGNTCKKKKKSHYCFFPLTADEVKFIFMSVAFIYVCVHGRIGCCLYVWV